MFTHVLRRLSVGAVSGALLVLPAGTAAVAEPQEPTPSVPSTSEPVLVRSVVPPTIAGEPTFRGSALADPGVWTPHDVDLTYQWYLDMVPVDGAEQPSYQPRRADIGRALVLGVTATHPEADEPVTALSDPEVVRKGVLENIRRPQVTGEARFGRILTAAPGRWAPRPDRVRYEWWRDGTRVRGADGRHYRLGVADFGRRLQVRVSVRKDGFRWSTAASRPTPVVGHRSPARHTVTYSVETRGALSASVDLFRNQVQATLEDPRGWRGSGVRFRQVRSGGDFTMVLSQAAQVPTFSSACSSEWSCRVGRYVVVNETRWQHASPLWNQRGGSLRDYRHMVVNHETGHWLGHGHRHCQRGGAAAPVMMQQSKGLSGCRPNPWPTAAERRTPRFG